MTLLEYLFQNKEKLLKTFSIDLNIDIIFFLSGDWAFASYARSPIT